MNSQEVYITANPTPNPDCLKFIVDRQIVDGDPVSFNTAQETEGSPLAQKIFELGHVRQLFAFQNFLTVTQDGDVPWPKFARDIGQAIRDHVQSGEANFATTAATATQHDDDQAIGAIKAVLDEIRPAVAMDGGNITFVGYNEGVVQVLMQGACSGCPSSTMTLKAGIESRLKEVLPEVKAVVAI